MPESELVNEARPASATNETASERPKARIVSTKERSRTIQLEYPVEFDGKLFESVTVRRMNVSEVSDFIEDARANGHKATLPMFDVPQEVTDALDADDAERINEAVEDFLPRSLRTAAA